MESCDRTKKVLAYCEDAIDEIRSDMPTGDLWVRRWASLLALLRTACEVLKKEAPIYWKQSMVQPNAGKKDRDAKNDWQPDIFGKFIWTNANLFLHQGLVREETSIMPHTRNMQMFIVQGATHVRNQELPNRFSYFMNSEPYKGRLALEVAAEAVTWLKGQIAIAER
jgi:hypothetical protein